MSQVVTSFSYFAAKSSKSGNGWLPVWMHASDTAIVIEHLCRTWLPLRTLSFLQLHGVPDVLSLAKFLAYVHDIGKITNAFQVKISHAIPGLSSDLTDKGVSLCEQNLSGQISHATAGEVLLLRMGIPSEIASIVGAHHGRPSSALVDANWMTFFGYDFSGHPDNKSVKNAWLMAEGNFVKWALQESGLTLKTLPKPDVEAQIVLTGLVIAADWISSNSWLFPTISCGTYGSSVNYDMRKQRALDRLKMPSRLESLGLDFDEETFKETFGFSMNEVQRMVFDAVRQSDDIGLMILEAPMGVGKTEAALTAANVLMDGNLSCGGLYFGLPTQATANGIFPRLKGWAETKCVFDSQTIALAHGNAFLNVDYQAVRKSNSDFVDSDGMLMRHELFGRSKLALLSDFVVGTIDQLLVAGLKQKHFMLRHLGLLSKVVIVDEVHAYDARMMVFLKTVLSWLGEYHVPVVLLSATLPSDRRCELVAAYQNKLHPEDVSSDTPGWMTTCAYPLLTYTIGDKVLQKTCSVQNLRKLSVKIDTLPERNLVDKIRPVVQNGGCAAVIVNSVAFSQQLAVDLQQAFSDSDVILLHSAFLAEHRTKIESSILSRLGKKSDEITRKGVILVGTQVLEQSLDYDVDLMVSEICPMDLLLQRMGRLWRHPSHDVIRGVDVPQFFVLEPEKIQRGTSKIYAPYLLRRTLEELPGLLSLPDDISPFVQKVYDVQGHEMDKDCVEWQDDINKHIRSAQVVSLSYAPGRRDWHGLLDVAAVRVADTDMSVRDSGISITPVCLFEQDDGTYRTFDGTVFDATVCPDEEGVKTLLKHRVSLMYKLVNPFEKAKQVTEELLAMSQPFAEWQSHVSLLENTLFCVFDKDLCVNLGGFHFTYHDKFGLLERSG